MNELNRASITNTFLWVYAAPVITTWSILSFIPLAGAFIEGASILSIIGDIIFLASGFLGLFSVYLFAIFCAARPEQKSRIARSLRGRIGFVSAYATLWLISYAVFKFYIA